MQTLRVRSLHSAFVFGCAILAASGTAATFTVNSTDDAGTGTLRQAITDANTAGGSNTIAFDGTAFAAPGPYTIYIGSALPDLNSNITITGPGANVLTVNGQSTYRVFRVTSGHTVSISGLTISGGRVAGTSGTPGSAGQGGGIFNAGSLTVTECAFTNNSAQGGSGSGTGAVGGLGQGGAIFSNGPLLTVQRCTFSTNSAIGGSGGNGAFINSTTHGPFEPGGNASNGQGGAIYADAASGVTITNSTFYSNSANGGAGGNSGFSNSPSNDGTGGPGGTGEGGAIFSAQALTITSCTIAGNSANGGAGGYNNNFINVGAGGNAHGGGIVAGGTVTSGNTLVAGNTANPGTGGSTGSDLGPDVYGAFSSNGYNLVSILTADASGFSGTADQTGTSGSPIDAKIDPLGPQNNGGALLTLRLRKGSPAVDKGKNLTSGVDQRGYTRPYDLDDGTYPNADEGDGRTGDGSDIGAFESQSLPNDVPVINAATTTIYGGIGTDISTVNGSTSNTASGTNNQLVATDGDSDTLTFSIVTGTMPDGLTFNSDGTITGTPTAAGETTISFKVNDGLADSSEATLIIRIGETRSTVVTTDIDNSTNYDGVTSLREAVAYAASGSAPGTTVTFDETFFAEAKTITLASAISINSTITINGSAAGVTISGGDATQIFTVFGFGDPLNFTLSNLTIAHGTVSAYSSGGVARIDYFDFGGGNVPAVTLTGCTLSNNGGNDIQGGVIYNNGAHLTLSNCTLANNHADYSTNTSAAGGAIYQNAGTLTIYNSTLAANSSSDGTGGAIAVGGSSGTVTIGNSIVALNIATTGPDISGTVTTAGYNIIGNTTGATVSATTGDQFNVDPSLDSAGLADNGGPTQTIALQSTSVAIDQGKAMGSVTTDQRGETRPSDLSSIENASGGDGSDIGAFEYQVPPTADLSITVTDGVTTATPGGSVTYTITVSNAGPDAVTGATVADTFPASLSTSWTGVGAGGGTGPATGSGDLSESVDLPAGGSFTFTVSATISSAATGSLSNTATVSSSALDDTPGNDSATDTDTLTPSADLSVTVTDGVTSVNAGGSLTYTITASNSGPSDATGVALADTFPASLGSISWTGVGAGGGTGTASGTGNIDESIDLPAGGSFTFTVSATLSASASGSLSNTATVTAPDGVTDSTPANNSATDTDTIVTPPTVTTPTSASITATSATLGGNVTSDGGSTVTERGIVYAVTSANNDPQIDGTGVTKVTGTGTTGVFTVSATGLTAGTAYSYAAYATNGIGTSYSSVGSFSTLSTDATLSGLVVNGASLTPGFASGTTSYTASVSSETTAVTVTPTATQGTATIKVNGGSVGSGNTSGAISVPVGASTITVIVTAPDGTTTKTYTIAMSRSQIEVLISITGLHAIYDGTPKSVIVSTSLPNVGLKVTYDDSTDLPTNAGTYTVVATVTNPSYTGSLTRTLTIDQASQVVYFPLQSDGYSGQSITLSATASSNLTPVTFTVIGGTGTITNDTTLTITGEGNITVQADQAGNRNYLPGQTVRTIASHMLTQAIDFPIPDDHVSTDAPFTLHATASSDLPVSFTIVSGPAMLSGSVVTLTGVAGTVVVRASQGGDKNYLAARDVTRQFMVTAEADRVLTGRGRRGQVSVPGKVSAREVTPTGDVAVVLPAGQNTGSLLIVAPEVGISELLGFTLNENGSFAVVATQTTESGPQAVEGVCQLSGNTLTGTFAAIDFGFTAELEPSDGPSADKQGLYTSSALGSNAGTTYTIIGANNNVLVLIVTPTVTVGGTATLQSNGSYTLESDNYTVTGVLDPATTAVSNALTVTNESGSTTIGFGGVKSTTLRTDRLINLSSRAHVGTGENVLIAGFVISGSTPKPVLIRAVGPGLVPLGVTTPLPNPQIRIVREGKVYATNENWGDGANPDAIAAAAARVGAFALAGGSADSAILTTLFPGVYTAIVSGGDGTALAEIYDASENPSADYQRLINISSRGYVGTGDDVLIGGLVISGNSPKRVLIRAVGPTLATQGIATPLVDPVLRVFKGSTVIASNDNWDANEVDAAALAEAALTTGAFALPAGSKDAAIILTLAPGIYTMHVRPADGTAPGVALAEIYEVPE